MKSRFFGLIAVLTIITVIMVACDTGGGDNGNNNNNNSNGEEPNNDKYANAVRAQGSNFAEKFDWVKQNAQAGGMYAIELLENVVLDSTQTFSFTPSVSNSVSVARSTSNFETTVILMSGDANVVVEFSLFGMGSIFTVEKNVNLVLHRGISLDGKANNNKALVVVKKDATLTMEPDTVIRNNTNSGDGGGVYIEEGAAFIMNGGAITDCVSKGSGGGVYIYPAGTFIMNGGSIERCSAGGSDSSRGGGGVRVDTTFTSPPVRGTFIMNGGAIFENTIGATALGIANTGGGGVSNHGDFTMNGGVISKNDITNTNIKYWGGGVVTWGTFTMTGGLIWGNTAGQGGGVNVSQSGIFEKTGGTIQGTEQATLNANKAVDTFDKDGVTGIHRGDAVYAYGAKLYRNKTHEIGKMFLDKSNEETALGWDGKAN